MDVVVCSIFSCITEYGDVDHVVGACCYVVLCSYHLAEACMKVCECSLAAVVVSMGDFDYWPRSKVAYWRVCSGEYDIRECVPVHHSSCAGVCLVIVGDSDVRSNFPNVGK